MIVRTALTFLLGAGVAGLAWTLHAVSDSNRLRDERLEGQVAAFEEKPVRTRRATPTRDEAPTPRAAHQAASSPADGGAVATQEPGAPDPGPALSTSELRAAYAEAFESEEVDATWARSAEAAYLPSIRRLLPVTSQLESFECRARFCRLRVVHDSRQTSNDFLLSLFSGARDGPLVSSAAGFRAASPEQTSDGKYAYAVYIARLGVGLALGREDDPQGPDVLSD